MSFRRSSRLSIDAMMDQTGRGSLTEYVSSSIVDIGGFTRDVARVEVCGCGAVSHSKIETRRRRRRLMADEYYTD